MPNNNHHIIWKKCLQIIKDNISSPQAYRTWFKPIVPLKLENNELVIQVPSPFFYEWIEEHYNNLMKRTLTEIIGENAKITYHVILEKSKENQEIIQLTSSAQSKPANHQSNDKSGLNVRYTFDNFIKGNSNQFAKAAAIAVAEAPGRTSFNPLVVYGGVGLGKTHIIQAIGNYVKSNDSSKKVLYISSEKFTIDFINSVKEDKTSQFSNYYRNVDVLLVDDIQFFTGKERTQEEFFHTFNSLYQMKKQIILTLDRPPRDLKGLEERLLSRFQWGLVTDIQAPDLEMRIAILEKRSEEDGIDIDPEIIQFIANNITSNIRELEGSLIRILAHSSLTGSELTIDLAKDVLKDMIKNANSHVTVEKIQHTVSKYYNIPENMLRAKTRKQEIVSARQVSMYLSKEMTSNSLQAIGLHFGGRDHTTVMHACKTIQEQLSINGKLEEDINILKRKIEIASF